MRQGELGGACQFSKSANHRKGLMFCECRHSDIGVPFFGMDC